MIRVVRGVDLVSDVAEAMLNVRKWLPVYRAVKKITGSKEDARKAILWLIRVEAEMEIEEEKRAA